MNEMGKPPEGRRKSSTVDKKADRTSARSGRSRAMADIVPQVGRAAFHRFGFVQSAVVSRWHEIVGQRYAQASAPESIRFPPGKRVEGTLTLTVESAFAPMLQQVVPEVMERVNRFFGYRAVARVVLKHGDVATSRPARPAPRPEVEVPGDMLSGLRAIADDGLRSCLESLARELCATSGPPVFDAKTAASRYHPAEKADKASKDSKGYSPDAQ